MVEKTRQNEWNVFLCKKMYKNVELYVIINLTKEKKRIT